LRNAGDTWKKKKKTGKKQDSMNFAERKGRVVNRFITGVEEKVEVV